MWCILSIAILSTRELVGGKYEMVACVHLDARLLQDEQHVQYRYFVADPNKGKCFEHLHDYGNNVANRCFRMSRKECVALQSSTGGNNCDIVIKLCTCM